MSPFAAVDKSLPRLPLVLSLLRYLMTSDTAMLACTIFAFAFFFYWELKALEFWPVTGGALKPFLFAIDTACCKGFSSLISSSYCALSFYTPPATASFYRMLSMLNLRGVKG